MRFPLFFFKFFFLKSQNEIFILYFTNDDSRCINTPRHLKVFHINKHMNEQPFEIFWAPSEINQLESSSNLVTEITIQEHLL